MNPQKRQQRLNELLIRLKNNADVPNRDLKLVLTESQYAEMQAQWQIEKSFRKITKPKEIMRYELMLKQATLAHIKYEAYEKKKTNKKPYMPKKLMNDAESLLEKAFEYAVEIGGKHGRFAEWFGGVIVEDVELDLSTMPRIRTSKSYWNDVGKNELSIRNIKILAVEHALSKHNVNNELDDATEAIKSFKTKRNFKDIKF
jgi:hypothetical protein